MSFPRILFATAMLLLLPGATTTFGADGKVIGGGTSTRQKVSGKMSFTCTPDAKSKEAGATPFDDTLELKEDHATSTKLAADGFPEGKSIPESGDESGLALKATFKKTGATATYSIHLRKGTADKTAHVSGTFVRVEGGKTTRYTVGDLGAAAQAAAAAATDPAVLHADGGFIRLMNAQAALADAGIKTDNAKLAAIIKSAGQDQSAMQAKLRAHTLTPADYEKQANDRLKAAHEALGELVGGGANAAKLEKSFDKPFASGFVRMKQMMAAARVVPDEARRKKVDQAVSGRLLELSKLAKKPDQLTPDAVDKIVEHAHADVTKVLGPDDAKLFDRVYTAMSSSGESKADGQTNGKTEATSAPAKK